MGEIRVTINPDRYLGQFQSALANHVAHLRNTLRSLEDGSALKRVQAARPGAVIRMQLEPSGIDAGAEAVATACNRCFLNLVRSLITYLDRLLAVRQFTRKETTLPYPIDSRKGFEEFVEGLLEDNYRQVATDTRFTNPKKLSKFSKLPDLPRRAALSYFALRRCLEHHGEVPTEDIVVCAIMPTMLADDTEVTCLPFSAAAGTTISIRMNEQTWTFKKGIPVRLDESQIESIFFTMQLFIAPQLRRAI